MIDFSVVTTEAELQALAPAWDDLLRRARGYGAFSDFGWHMAAWRDVAAPRGCWLRVIVGRVSGRVVLIWPLVLDGGTLRFLCSEKFEYRDVLVETGPSAESWTVAAWRFARRRCGASWIDLRDVPVGQPGAAAWLARAADHAGARALVRITYAPVIRLARHKTFEMYAATLPARLQADQRRQWRRLENWPGDTGFHVVDDPTEAAALVQWMTMRKLEWAAERSIDVGAIREPGYRRFLAGVMGEGVASGAAMVCRLGGAAAPLSAGCGLVVGDRFCFYMFAYDPAAGTLSPSRLLLERVIRWCMANGLVTFDFLPGEEAYKPVWANDREAVADYVVPVSLWGHVRIAWGRHAMGWLARRPWVMRVYRAVPTALRARVRRRLSGGWDLLSDMETPRH
ncbi:MAG: GNAT family N-acetyltransferase [Rhodospirillales bacterium]|nr:GNAT family N-acetyltransferase [Rhodospirillales bacterium]